MKAMILAAGAGTRLYPLTAQLPKPMVPVANRPVLEHVMRAVTRHDFRELAINLSYLPQAITAHFGDGAGHGARIHYSHEEEPLGTAGGVRKLADYWDDGTFLVIGGDDLTDMDLAAMLAFHRAHGGLATLALYPVADPSRFGVVVTGPDGRVTAFQEKPPPQEARSNLCNMQVYLFEPAILELIPEGFFDFGRHLFPALVAQGAPIYGYQATGYWRDIGSLEDYLAANVDFLCGHTNLAPPAGGRPDLGAGVQVVPPLCLGQGVMVHPGAMLGPNCVIGDGCEIHSGAKLSHCVLWPGVQVKAGTVVSRAIVTPHCTVEVPPEGEQPCAPSGKA